MADPNLARHDQHRSAIAVTTGLPMMTVHAPVLTPLREHAGHVPPAAARGHHVVFDLGDGTLYLEHADRVFWGAGDPDAGGAGRVLRYAVMVPADPALLPTATLASA